MAKERRLYADDGVDTGEGDTFSRRAARICRASYGNSPYVRVRDFSRGHFRGPRGYSFRGLPRGYVKALAADGAGTKTVVTVASELCSEGGFDVLAMTAMDITRWGGLALLIIDTLDARTIGKAGTPTNDMAIQLMESLGRAAKENRMVVYGGETAELGVCVGSDNPDAALMYNWTGTAQGVYHPSKMILGETLAPGQSIMALRELGFRSNGWSSVRKGAEMHWGPEWYNDPEAKAALREAAVPSKLYDMLLTQLNGWWSPPHFEEEIQMHLIVHVTGGAVRSKLAEDILFRLGLSAELPDLWEPPRMMREVVKWRGMPDDQCYETFGCGNGALVVIEQRDEARFVGRAAEFDIEARKAGEITRAHEPRVKIVSQFTGNEIVFHPQ